MFGMNRLGISVFKLKLEHILTRYCFMCLVSWPKFRYVFPAVRVFLLHTKRKRKKCSICDVRYINVYLVCFDDLFWLKYVFSTENYFVLRKKN